MSQMVNYGSELIRINRSKRCAECSTNGGSSWYSRGTFPNGSTPYDMIVYGNELIVSTDKGICCSTNKGSSWYTRCSDHNVFNASLALDRNKILAMTSNGVYCSTNKGSSWYRK